MLVQLAARKIPAREETADEDDDGDDHSDDDDDENEDGSGMQEQRVEKQTSKVRNWRWRRQFNHVLGIGVDAPAGQPQTNAYDIHNTQQGSAPWESHSGDNVTTCC